MTIELNQEELFYISDCLSIQIEILERQLEEYKKNFLELDKNKKTEIYIYDAIFNKCFNVVNDLKKIKGKIDAC
jgi:hypothetical protein